MLRILAAGFKSSWDGLSAIAPPVRMVTWPVLARSPGFVVARSPGFVVARSPDRATAPTEGLLAWQKALQFNDLEVFRLAVAGSGDPATTGG